MAKNNSRIGTSVEAHNEQRRARSRKFQETQDRLRPFEEIARRHHAASPARVDPAGARRTDEHHQVGGLRIESGQHRSGTDTLRRLAEALDGHAVIGFEFDSTQAVAPELVRL
ncbi:MAG: hypothetical protein M5T61_20690 [Acidimicrobiia bacterium]|nr:hypothetical protein [Acidimicrobiia bacterium]